MRRYLVLSVLGVFVLLLTLGIVCRCWWQHVLRREELPGPKAPVHRGSRRERPQVRPALYQPGHPLPGNRRGNQDRVDLPGIPDSHQEREIQLRTERSQRSVSLERYDHTDESVREGVLQRGRVRQQGWSAGLWDGLALMDGQASGSGILGDRRSSHVVRGKGHQAIERHGALLDHPLMASLLGEAAFRRVYPRYGTGSGASRTAVASLVRCAAGMIE